MSALLAPNPKTPSPRSPGRSGQKQPGDKAAGRTRLRPLASPPRRMARLPFLAVLIAAFGLGMAGLLMLNTTLQNQAFEARTLTRQATELTYVEANLSSQLDSVSAPSSLALKASQLGMRANPYPAFLVLPSGKVIGKPKAVKGDELPELVMKTPAQLAAEKAAGQAKAATDAQAKAQEAVTAAQAAATAAQAQQAADDAQKKADAAQQKADQKKADQKKAGN